jgi:hypothetical protein
LLPNAINLTQREKTRLREGEKNEGLVDRSKHLFVPRLFELLTAFKLVHVSSIPTTKPM